MRVVSLILKTLLFLLLLTFAIKNGDPVTVRYLLGMEWQAPLSLVLFVVFAVGVLLGLLGCSRHLIKGRRERARLEKSLAGEPR